jgi:VWFA-related protein
MFRGFILAAVLLTSCPSFAQDAPAFSGQTNLVLLPFHVTRGKEYVEGLKPEQVVLLEDGKPRPFAIFEDQTQSPRTPVELVLLFDTTTKPGSMFWDPSLLYTFAQTRNEMMSRAILGEGAELRVSIYRFQEQRLRRLCPPTKDPRELTEAFFGLLSPMEPDEGTALSVPANRKPLFAPGQKSFTSATGYPFYYRGRPLEAAMETLRALDEPHTAVRRALVIFSEGVGDTTSTPRDAAERALSVGVPVYPVVLNYGRWLDRKGWRDGYMEERRTMATPEERIKSDHAAAVYATPNLEKLVVDMDSFGKLGTMTGGNSLMNYDKLNAGSLQEILRAVIGDTQSQYLVGFVPPSSALPKPHKLEVRLAAKTTGTISSGKRTAIY